jgi:transglutaminase-like putative cysteine protease
MSYLKENKIFMLLIYINILFVVTLAKESYKINNFDYFFTAGLITAGVAISWFYSTALKRKGMKTTFTLLLIISATAYYMFKREYVNSLFKLHILDNFIAINTLVAEAQPTDFLKYRPIFILVLPFLVFVVAQITSKGLTNSILFVNLILTLTLWYLGYTEEIKKYLFHYVLISLITFSANSFVRKMNRLVKKGVKVGIENGRIFVYTILVSLFIAGISGLMPQDYQGKYSSEIQGRFYNKFGNTAESGEQKGKKYKYDLSFSGYDSSSEKLGGPITVNKLIAFKVKSDNTYYLRGGIKDYYDGSVWKQTDKTYTKRSYVDESMLKDTFSNVYVDRTNFITIYPEELNSSTIFTPNLSYNVHIQADYIYSDEASTFISSGFINDPYTVYFYSLNSRGNRILNLGGSQNPREVPASYYEDAYKKYLQVPDNISTRVYDLVKSIVKDKRNNFLKVQAIREYLNKNYPYTLKVSEIPEGEEFLDYFLFTEKKGYCTYFATAETIMCRIAGIPARYVEGFNMTQEVDENGLFIVRNENAHAWTEVLYLENQSAGMWYTVDAVPYAVEAIRKEEELAKQELENTEAQEITPNVIPPKKPAQEEEELSGGGEAALIIPPVVLKALYTILIVIAINIIAVLVFVIRISTILRSRSNIPIYKYSLYRLETIGYRQSDFTPDMEFIGKMNKGLSEKVWPAAELAYGEYYGGKEPVEFNKKEYYGFIEGQIKMRQTRFQYFIKKYYFSKKISLIFKSIMVLYRRIRTI